MAVRKLPLFSFPEVVLFCRSPIPLHIFEFLYSMMINTVLENDSCFGVFMVNFLNGKITKVGYCSKVIRFQRLPDDCIKVLILRQ
ncbi:MAG: LON peptidase substrate-binding domain-containing protein [cyanobacterium endosymbiont of Rhopalodia yunnanensis]